MAVPVLVIILLVGLLVGGILLCLAACIQGILTQHTVELDETY